jgi:septal ring factor EnvC (AmiA/AmiB activator)
MAEAARRELRAKDLTVDRRKQIEKTLSVAEEEVANVQTQIGEINVELARLNERLAAIAGEKIKPEYFQLRLPQPPLDEQRKKLATKVGYNDAPGVEATL